MSASEPDRAMTPFHLFEGKIPGPPPLPTGTGSGATDRSAEPAPPTGPPPSPMDAVHARLAAVEDHLVSPGGLLHNLFAGLERRAQERHEIVMRGQEEIMRTLTTIANGQMDLSDRLAQLEPEVERHGARLSLAAVDGSLVAGTGGE
jgi:hypothetical protein